RTTARRFGVSVAAHPAVDELLAETLPTAQAWEARVRAALDAGWRFAGLDAARERDGGAHVRVALAHEHRLLLLACRRREPRVPTLTGLTPAARWDEREAHDLHDIRFDGHDQLSPLVEHPAQSAAWTTRVRGRDVHQVAVGPIHAGVIESGHFRFHVVGERILHLDLQLFHKHRGLERAADWLPAPLALAQLGRACGACAVTNAVAFAHAYETATGLWPHPQLRRARTLLLEFERLYNHLGDIAAICAGVGLAAGTTAFAALKERAHRLNARLTGHRFLFDTVTLARSDLTISRDSARDAAAQLDAIGADFARAWRQLQFSHSAQERFAGCGVLPRSAAERLGAVGPAARASGIADDVRCHSPRLSYPDFEPAAPQTPSGDVAARLELRGAELTVTLALLADLLARPLRPASSEPLGCASGLGAARVESPRGATLCTLELDDERVLRPRLRTGSYANWPALARVMPGELLPDFPLVNKSFELCYACVDR
ncbi:MAG TPA: NADH-quinone oxidoreductase subunit C, partial [Conexibacter sp.]|nr:NADH-quinone oxidoreductase subunit C [Conexibacter sp.]